MSFVQNSDEDTVSKGKMFWERFPIYFKYADELHLFWTKNFKEGSIKAATIDRSKGLVVLDKGAYEAFVKQYEGARAENKELLPFESFLK